MANVRRKVYRWLEDRLPVSQVRDAATHKTVPIHRWSLFYYLGGMTLFFFLVQVATGILLMLYYRPSADAAYESVEFIMTTVPFGWLIRSIHSWSANLMVFFAVLHLLSVFFLKSYRKPRELTWVSGVFLLFLTLGFGFSGYLLPWNELAFFATKVGTDIAGAVPLVGDFLVRFLRGGDHVTGGTLSRFYGWHVAILPALVTAFVLIHLLLVQLQGMSVPPKVEEKREKEGRPARSIPFFPHFLLRELFGWTLALAVLATLAALFPWELGEKADPFAPAPANIRPEWYFMFMFQTLKLVPGGEIFGLEYEAIPILLFGLGGLLLILVPFLERGDEGRIKSSAFTVAGIVVCIYAVALTAWGYHSWVPVWVVLLSAVVLLLLRVGVREPGGAVARLLPLLLLLLPAGPLAAQTADGELSEPDVATSCVACHGDPDWVGEDAAQIVDAVAGGAHGRVGLSCHDCHGGNPDPALAEDMTAAMDPDDPEHPYVGIPTRAEVPEFCGTCHSDPNFMKRFQPDARTDQVSEYWTSQHGMLLRQGDENVATCIDCHGVHGILGPSDSESPVFPTQVAETCATCHSDAEYMEGYTLTGDRPLPVDQYQRWRRSVHAAAMFDKEDLSAPTCNDCHGNHGATPPGLESIAFVCGQCHGREADLFRASAKQEGYEEHNELFLTGLEGGCAECHAEPEPAAEITTVRRFTECATCHGNHAVIRPTVALLGPLPETPCAFCHEGPEPVAEAYQEPEERRESFEAQRDALLQRAAELELEGDDRFDWLVDQIHQIPQHVRDEAAEGGREGSRLQPEVQRLFDKFRIGKTHFTYEDPSGDGEIRESVVRCTGCHGPEVMMTDEPRGFRTSQALLDHMHELTALTARAERILLTAHRGGVAVRDTREKLDQAVDAEIELQALVHSFSAAEDGAFMERQREGVETARAAIEAGRAALDELTFRRRGLALSLVIILLVLIALGWKIRTLPPPGSAEE